MNAKHRFRPNLEGLESRWTPATIRLVAGNLFITNPTGNLSVTSQASNTVLVNDSGKLVTVSGVGGLISITGTNANNTITFDATVPYNGNLLVNSGNGNDTVNLIGTLGGNATLLTGSGADSVALTGDATISGGLSIVDPLGGVSLSQAGNALAVGGNLAVTGITSYTPGTGALTVGGNVSFTAGRGLNMLLTLNGALGVGGSLSVRGSSGDDVIAASSPTTSFAIVGNATFALGDGTNGVGMQPTAFASSIGGNLSYTGGSGQDVLALSGNLAVPVTVDGNVTVNLGEGNANRMTHGVAGVIGGHLSVTSGNGNSGGPTTFSGVVNGDLSITLGNGNNTGINVDRAPAGTLRYRAGNGTNVLRINGTDTYLVDLLFGTGTDTLTFTGASTVNGRIVGTGGNYTLNQSTAVFSPNLQLINFP